MGTGRAIGINGGRACLGGGGGGGGLKLTGEMLAVLDASTFATCRGGGGGGGLGCSEVSYESLLIC